MQHDSRGKAMNSNQTLCFKQVHRLLDGLFDGDLHAKRVLSLANATLGVIKTRVPGGQYDRSRPGTWHAAW